MSEQFLDCASFSANYDIRGIVTVTYSVVHSNASGATIKSSVSAGGQTFAGYVTSISTTRISGTTWYETTVTLVAMT